MCICHAGNHMSVAYTLYIHIHYIPDWPKNVKVAE